jgi:phosphohistidine phosphatase
MTRELLLLRHGKSARDAATEDIKRPLTDRGKRGAQRIGVWLAQQQFLPDLVISSPAERALVTAEKCCKVMGIGASDITQDKRIYLGDPAQLLEVLADCPASATRVMLVGHNPGLEHLLELLAEQPPEVPEDGKLMPTATLARLQTRSGWDALAKGRAKLLQLIRASSLPKKFPFPMPDGEDRRDRPAYYYTQSSVIPYRVDDGQLQILIIRSSQDKHWVVPKGIADPGHSLQDSARKEAWEEAGVEGKVDDEALGSYSYPKWGSTCSVTVYPMAVTLQLPEEVWEERHRGRMWVSPKKAVELLKQREVHPMIVALEKRFAAD